MEDTPKLQFIPYQAGRLAYREAGRGRALFLLHGMNGNSRSWRWVFEALAPSFRVVAWDAPSFGASDMHGNTVEDYANAAKALMESIDLHETIVVGHSMGGVIAVSLASRQDCSITGLVLSSTHLGFALPAGAPLLPRYATRIDKLRAEGANAAYALERARRSTPDGTPAYVVQFLAEIAKDARIEGIRDGGRMSQEADNARLVPDVRIPVLILSGGKDSVISPEMHSALVAAFPSAQQVVFPNAGHAAYVECPALFNEQIRQFAIGCKDHGLSA